MTTALKRRCRLLSSSGGAVLDIRAAGSWATTTQPAVYNRPDLRAGVFALLMSELAKRLPDDLLERRDRMRNAGESAVGFGFAKAHTNEGLKRLCACVSDGGTDGAAVRSAIGVGEREPGSGRARDDERAVVGSAVVGAAQGEEIGDQVFPAFAATLEVMRFRKDRVPATGDATFRVSAQDRAPLCGRDGLGGAGLRGAGRTR